MITVRGGADKRMATLSNGSCTYYADVPVESSGTGLYPRPGEYLMSAFAACMNMTTRGLLNERNASYEEVVTKVELTAPTWTISRFSIRRRSSAMCRRRSGSRSCGRPKTAMSAGCCGRKKHFCPWTP